MEVRRGGGTASTQGEPGEIYHRSDPIRGGTWRSVGRPPQRLVGIGFAGTGVADPGSGFHRLEGSEDPRVAFIFEGVGRDEIIGDFGLNQGGAAGFEVDRFDAALGSPPEAILLASASDLPPSFIGANEEGVGCAPHDSRVRGDMVYFRRPSGAEVFAVGSITWTGSLSHKGYNNNVARISTNVLHHFLTGSLQPAAIPSGDQA
jgi:N,N-dimethylformamidase